MPGTLYVVATPIGNLRDLTLRALDTLRAVNRVAAEDTRHSRKLLQHYGIAVDLLALHEHNERNAAQRVVEYLQRGEAIALVSDAGTPAISDPGGIVVAAARAAGFAVVPLPGPCALVTALSVSGLAPGPFLFAGFLPAKPAQRRQMLDELVAQPHTLAFYEAPHRILECVRDLAAQLGGERTLVLARELTKAFEQVYTGQLSEAGAWLEADPVRQKGEFVLLVGPAPAGPKRAVDAEKLLRRLLEELPPAKAARLAAEISGEERSALYARALEWRGQAA